MVKATKLFTVHSSLIAKRIGVLGTGRLEEALRSLRRLKTARKPTRDSPGGGEGDGRLRPVPPQGNAPRGARSHRAYRHHRLPDRVNGP